MLTESFTESSELLTLHNINKMRPDVCAAVDAQLNETRNVENSRSLCAGAVQSLCTVTTRATSPSSTSHQLTLSLASSNMYLMASQEIPAIE